MLCDLRDDVEVSDRAALKNVVLANEVRIYGTATLIGEGERWTLAGGARVERGVWTRPPRCVDLGVEWMTESRCGALIGCQFRTYTEWLKRAARIKKSIAKRARTFDGWTLGQIEEAVRILKEWAE